jgi:hypothetical protein
VDAVRGAVALARGPLVYCLEQADLPAGTVLEDVSLDPAAPIALVADVDPAARPAADGDLLLGVPGAVLVSAGGSVPESSAGPLYRPYPVDGQGGGASIRLTAVPYFLWGNRAGGGMRVWIPLAPAEAEDRETIS